MIPIALIFFVPFAALMAALFIPDGESESSLPIEEEPYAEDYPPWHQ